MELILLIALLIVVICSLLYFIKEDKMLHEVLDSVISKLCVRKNYYNWSDLNSEYKQYDEESGTMLSSAGPVHLYLPEEVTKCKCGIAAQTFLGSFSNKLNESVNTKSNKTVLSDGKNYADPTKETWENDRNCCRPDDFYNRAGKASRTEEIAMKNRAIDKQLEKLRDDMKCKNCSRRSYCGSSCGLREKQYEIYQLMQSIASVQNKCSCPKSAAFFKEFNAFLSSYVGQPPYTRGPDRNFPSAVNARQLKTLKFPPSNSGDNLNWYITLDRAGEDGIICKLRRKEDNKIGINESLIADSNVEMERKSRKTKKHKKSDYGGKGGRSIWHQKRSKKKL